ncbi:MAG: hypothetical protein ACKO85_15610 [Isosphaeraceae bacterium]
MKQANQSRDEGFRHVAAKVAEILAGPLADTEKWPEDRRWWLQLGFNLGRFSELSEEGRKVWDDWKSAIETGDRREMQRLTDYIKSYETQSKN